MQQEARIAKLLATISIAPSADSPQAIETGRCCTESVLIFEEVLLWFESLVIGWLPHLAPICVGIQPFEIGL
jgi:hypothetical protein